MNDNERRALEALPVVDAQTWQTLNDIADRLPAGEEQRFFRLFTASLVDQYERGGKVDITAVRIAIADAVEGMAAPPRLH
jgi:hypothetical protein